MTNNDLKMGADATYEECAQEMTSVYNTLLDLLDDEGRQELMEAQEAWSVFAEKQARFSGGLMRDGTGESLLYLQEICSLMRWRLNALQEAIRERSFSDETRIQ